MIRTRMSLFGSLALSVLACTVCRPASAQLTFTYTPFNLGDGSITDAFGLSNTGDIVGAGHLNNDYHGIVRHNGVDTALDYSGAGVIGTTLTSINSSGDVTGLRYYYIAGVGNYTLEFLYHNGIVFTAGDPISGLPPGSLGAVDEVGGVNDAGKVGIGYFDNQFVEHGAIYDIASSTFTPVPDPLPEETNSNVLFVAPNGDYLQQYYSYRSNDFGSVLIHDGIATNIDFPGAEETDAYIINASGLIAGTYYTGFDYAQHGFVYDHGAYYSLDYPGSFGTEILYGLNDADQIVGTYYSADYYPHGLLIQITPEPDSVALLVGMGITGADFLLRRRNRIRRAA